MDGVETDFTALTIKAALGDETAGSLQTFAFIDQFFTKKYDTETGDF